MSYPLTPLALGILSTLRDRPMHPYEIRQTMLERKHDEVIRMPGGSLYSTIDRLLADGYIAVIGTERAGKRPERTIYDLTPTGEVALLDWLRMALATPGGDALHLASVIAFLPHLMPDEARDLLRTREAALRRLRGDHDLTMQDAFWSRMPRMFRLHADYRAALWQAELDWVAELVTDIEEGTLTWPPMIVAWHERRGTWHAADTTVANEPGEETT